jgi:maleylacetate reductase
MSGAGQADEPAASTPPMSFARRAMAGRVVFGPGKLDVISEEAGRLGALRVLLIAGGSAKPAGDRAAGLLGPLVAARWTEVARHVPADLAARARAECSRVGADAVVSIGGGAATGLAKAIALRLAVPIIAVPTTYAGSEVTPVWGLTESQRKSTGRSEQVLPRTVIYDPLLTTGLPAGVTASSGMNAMAHCVEAVYAPGANPVTTLLALAGAGILARCLPALAADPADLGARSEALYAAYLAGCAMAEAGTGLHHRICHVLGGMYDLPHAELHATLLPYTVACVEARDPAALAPVAAALAGDTAAGALYDLSARLGTATSLRQLGVTPAQAAAAVPRLAEALAPPPDQPAAAPTADQRAAAPTAAEIAALLDHALAGQRPT